ncbi:MAG: DUF5685 family protein [Oscillospiraceae bacterium]|nr:DUF5685 family protein [Oscillospiraceae bacterium]
MLGYVKTYKPELKIKDYEAYRGLYCSLCRTLGRQYGVMSRLLLSYDVTFLLVVMLSVKNALPTFKKGRCPFNLAKRCNYCVDCSSFLSFAAAVTVLMFYYKVKDNIADSGFFKRLLMRMILPYASHLRKKALKKYKRLDSIISGSMNRQGYTEANATDNTDRAAHESADTLGKIFCYDDADNIELYRFGYSVGRWVYLLDAADDIEKDLKNKSYNVFVNRYQIHSSADFDEDIKKEVEATLNMSRAQALEALSNLGQEIFTPVIENILTDGMSASMNKVLKGKEK